MVRCPSGDEKSVRTLFFYISSVRLPLHYLVYVSVCLFNVKVKIKGMFKCYRGILESSSNKICISQFTQVILIPQWFIKINSYFPFMGYVHN